MRPIVLPSLALVGIVAFLWPTLHMPYLGDDTFNAYIDGWTGYERLTLGSALVQFFEQTGLAAGRFDPIFPLIIFFNYHVVHSVVALKILVLVAIVVNAASLYVLVRLYARGLATSVLVVLPAVFQIRFFHDALIQFSLHLQIALEFALLAAISLTLYARTKRVVCASSAVALYACAALTYEATYAFVVPLVILAMATVPRRRDRFALCAAFAAVPIVLSAIILILRSHTPVPANSPYAVTFVPGAVLRVIELQVIGALPLSYAIANPNESLPPLAVQWRTAPQIWIVAAAWFALAFAAFRSPVERPKTALAFRVGAFAFLVVLASTAMIALSPRWQAELKIGLAYIPVYFEAFAMAVLLAALASIVARAIPFRAGSLFAAAAVAVVVGTTYRFNTLTLAQYTAWSLIMPRALDAGILRDASDGDAVFLDDSYPANSQDEGSTWNVKYYLYAHTAKRLVAAHLANLPTGVSAGTFALAGDVRDFTSGTVAAGPIASVVRDAQGNIALLEHANVFVATSAGAHTEMWASTCGPLPLPNIIEAVPSGLLVRYDSAFSVLEHDGPSSFHWARGNARIVFDNPTAIERKATVRFTLRPASAAKHVRYGIGGHMSDRPSDGSDLSATSEVVVAPHETASIAVDSDNAPIAHDPAGRILRFEVRDLHVSESACSAARRV